MRARRWPGRQRHGRLLRRQFAAAAAATGVVLGLTCASGGWPSASASNVTAASQASFPATPAGVQGRWLLAAVQRPPIPASELRAHFDAAFLAQVPPAQLAADLAHFAGFALDSVASNSPTSLVAVIDDGTAADQVLLDVDGRGLISGLLLRPLQEAPSSLPATLAGSQAHWLFGALDRLPISVDELRQHFDAAFLSKVPPAQLNAALESVGPLSLVSVASSGTGTLALVVETDAFAQLTMSLTVDAHGLIATLAFEPVVTPARSWAQVDEELRSVAPDVAYLVASVRGRNCVVIHDFDGRTASPLGSAFKLYVLDALARAVAAHSLGWSTELTLTAAEKSLPSGVLQNDPVGTRLSVEQVAAKMISISDNTAADMLMDRLGRSAIEAATRSAGMKQPSLDVPFLTTRELFALKLDDWPTLASRYLALPAADRLAFLAADVDDVPLSTLEKAAPSWSDPRDVEKLEWFASPADMCLVFASLAQLAAQPGMAPLASILEQNDGGLGLAGQSWRRVWFKGGSEPGVLTLNYLATSKQGTTYVVSVLASDPSEPLESSATSTLLGAVKGAFELASR